MKSRIPLSMVLAACCSLPAHLRSQDNQEASRATKRLVSRFEKGKLATNPLDWGQIKFDVSQINSTPAAPTHVGAIRESIRKIWKAWIEQDTAGYLSQVAVDATVLSQQVGKRANGHQQVAALLAEEWNAYERPAGTIAMKITVQQCEMEIVNRVARVQYWMQVEGGARWGFKDLVLICQFFQEQAGHWKLSYQTDSWGLAYNVQEQKPGKRTFDFDYFYPVKDLARAVTFYTPLLGPPEVLTVTRATFMLEGHRFHLDTSTLNGHAEVEARFPCGYAVFYTTDLDADLERLRGMEVTIVQGIEKWGNDPYIICEDPSENIFVIMQKTSEQLPAQVGQPPRLILDPQDTDKLNHGGDLKEVMQAWLSMDIAAMNKYIDGRSSWFDDSRSKVDGVSVGARAMTAAWKRDWKTFDRSPAGLMADMEITGLTEKRLGKWSLLCYRRKLVGKGTHPFKETAWVSQVFEPGGKVPRLRCSYTVRANNTNAPVKELDYTGYPVSSLRSAEKFYTDVVRLGNPYRDTAYRGYWSNNAVFGIYTSKLNRDGLPRPHKTNGYVSFWINSASETHAYLQKQGVSFPKIPAINSRSGIDPQPGYTQILATDSEGNAVLFTEYPGN